MEVRMVGDSPRAVDGEILDLPEEEAQKLLSLGLAEIPPVTLEVHSVEQEAVCVS